MVKIVEYKKNRIVYPLKKTLNSFIVIIFSILTYFLPRKHQNQLKILQSSDTFYNIFGLTLFNAIGGFVVILTNVKIANVLGASLYGLYSYYLAVGEVGQNFVRYGRSKTMTRDLIQYPTKFDSLISNTFIIGLLNMAIYLLVVIAFSGSLNIEITLPTIFLLLAPCLGSLDFQPVYEALKEMSWHSIYLLLQKMTFLIGVWAYILFSDKLSLAYLGVVLFLSWFCVVYGQYWEIVKQFRIKIRKYVSFQSIKLLYKENFVIALSCMTAVAFGPLIRLILNNYTDAQSVGIFSAGMQIFLISQFMLHQISRVGNPMMAEAGKSDCSIADRRKFCNRYFLLMLLGSIPFAIPLCIFPHIITNIFFSSEYSELGCYLPMFGLYLIALTVGVVYTQFLISIRKDKIYFTIFVGTALVTAFVAMVIIPYFKVWGAVISLCVPNSIGCLLYYACSIKYLK